MAKARDTLKVKEVSNWNQAQILLLRQDDFLTKAHYLHDLAFRIEEGKNLPAALSAFKHAILTTKWAISENDRKALMKDLKKFEESLARFLKTEYRQGVQDPQALSNYAKLYSDMYDLFDKFYQAQQNVLLGIPKKRREDPEARLEESFQ